MKHTEGEWELRKEGDILRIKNKEIYIATAHGLEDGKNNSAKRIEAEANAKIIAASPDLLEALQLAKETLDKYSNVHPEVYMKINNAIKKAS